MIYLTKPQLLRMHRAIAFATGGEIGLRDEGLLESALRSPFQTFCGEELYPTLAEKAARLGFCLTTCHPFVDGNKRISLHAMLVFLALNDVETECSPEELTEVGLALADGTMEYEELKEWIERFC